MQVQQSPSQMTYFPTHSIPIKKNEAVTMYKNSTLLLLKQQHQQKKNPDSTYSLCESRFDPSSSPPVSDFMKRLSDRQMYYNKPENLSKLAKT
jgi:hypothetical protein